MLPHTVSVVGLPSGHFESFAEAGLVCPELLSDGAELMRIDHSSYKVVVSGAPDDLQ